MIDGNTAALRLYMDQQDAAHKRDEAINEIIERMEADRDDRLDAFCDALGKNDIQEELYAALYESNEDALKKVNAAVTEELELRASDEYDSQGEWD